jgi:hypothetical protein
VRIGQRWSHSLKLGNRIVHGDPELLLRLMGTSVESLEQQILSRIKEYTFVGGKRVVRQELPELPKDAVTTVHRVKVSLYGTKPPVWRRLENPSAMPLNLVHAALQIAFDWHGYLLHVFETVPALDSCRRRYGEILWIVQERHLATARHPSRSCKRSSAICRVQSRAQPGPGRSTSHSGVYWYSGRPRSPFTSWATARWPPSSGGLSRPERFRDGTCTR